jgi:hypothetical protein
MDQYLLAFIVLGLVAASTLLCIYLNRHVFSGTGTATMVYAASFGVFVFGRFTFDALSYVDVGNVMREPGFALLAIAFLFLVFGMVGWVVTAVQVVERELRQRRR